MYFGWTNFPCDDELLAKYYQQQDFKLDNYINLNENEYCIITHNDQPVQNEIWKKKNGEIKKVNFQTLNSSFSGKTKPLEAYQTCAIDLLLDDDIPVKVIRGVYGSGKDLLMFNYALQAVEQGKFDKIIYIRPNVTVAGVPDIGYLKGSEEDKLGWTLGPLYDKVGGEDGINLLIDQGKLEMAPLLFIRGRSFDNCIIYVSEGQNITSEIAKLILGRVGKNTQLLINGDSHQVDNRLYEKDNGITKMLNKLVGNKLFGYVYLPETHRSEVAKLCDLMED